MICPTCNMDTAKPLRYPDSIGYECSSCGTKAIRKLDS